MTYVKLDQLVLNPDNPRILTEDGLRIIKESLQENPDFFQYRPIIASSRTGTNIIWCGNTRYMAARALGYTEVPAVILNLTPKQERQWAVRDNVSNGSWDWDKLANEWDEKELEAWGLHILDVGGEEEKKIQTKEAEYEKCPECGQDLKTKKE